MDLSGRWAQRIDAHLWRALPVTAVTGLAAQTRWAKVDFSVMVAAPFSGRAIER